MTIRKITLLLLPLLATVILPAEGAGECVFPGAVWEQTTPESQGVDPAKLQATEVREFRDPQAQWLAQMTDAADVTSSGASWLNLLW